MKKQMEKENSLSGYFKVSILGLNSTEKTMLVLLQNYFNEKQLTFKSSN